MHCNLQNSIQWRTFVSAMSVKCLVSCASQCVPVLSDTLPPVSSCQGAYFSAGWAYARQCEPSRPLFAVSTLHRICWNRQINPNTEKRFHRMSFKFWHFGTAQHFCCPKHRDSFFCVPSSKTCSNLNIEILLPDTWIKYHYINNIVARQLDKISLYQ